MKKNTVLLSLLFALSVHSSFAQLKLWYTEPAGNEWTAALPIGNGRLAGMVFGNVAVEKIQLNEGTVWTGSPNRNDNPDALASLPEIRKLIFEGKQKEAESLAGKTIQSKKSHGQMYQPVGNLLLAFDGHEQYTDYYRELDISRAITKTSYRVNGVQYTREIFTSVPDQVMVIRLSANKPASISLTASINTLIKDHNISTDAKKQLSLAATTGSHEGVKGMVKLKALAKTTQEGGRVTHTDTSIQIAHADAVTIFVSIATNFTSYKDLSGDENKRAAAYLDKAASKTYTKLLTAHVQAYQHYFNRVALDLGTTDDVKLPTNVRLKNFAKSGDPQFAALYFQYGRYLLISSSQPGGQPATLQGLWNDRMSPPWDSKYTININTQMNYWPAEKTNLSELHEPLVKMVQELSETGKETARVMYGARGWMAHHNTDLWRITGPVDQIFWGIWSMGGAWLSQHLWEKYLYSGDKKFLQDIYPVLKGAAIFFVDDLVQHPNNKWLVINPGTSPENAPKAHGGSSFDAGTTMDNQIVFDMLTSTIHAAELLGRDPKFVDTLKSIRSKLPPMHIGQYGQLQEWLEDIDDPNDKHRHISHLYGLFPSQQISAYRSPELFSAARTTLIHRGDISTGWSMGWKVNWWARMQDGNHAYKLIQNQLSPLGVNAGGGTYTNLFDAHPPFQIDGNFGCTSGITEMLMQSHDGAIHLLPALPDVWMKQGSITGIRARGGFTITELKWQDGKVVSLVITSNLGGNCRIRVPNSLKPVGGFALRPAMNRNTNLFYQTDETEKPIISPRANVQLLPIKETSLFDFQTKKGQQYRFVAQ